MKKRTLIIYNYLEDGLKYTIVDGDYSRFHGVTINSTHIHPHTDECSEWLFDKETGELNHNFVYDKSLIENKEWDLVAVITFLP